MAQRKKPVVMSALKTPAPGASGKSVKQLQDYLVRFGYLSTPAKPAKKLEFVSVRSAAPPLPDAEPGVFDEETVAALKSYQAFHGLPPTGQLDLGTVSQMDQSRCGVPDIPGGGSPSARFLTRNKWKKTQLTYRFKRFGRKVSEELARLAVVEALKVWSQATPLTFTETSGEPDMEILFVTGSHGDGDPFDGRLRVLAHAFYPPPNGGSIAGDVHFDDDEDWAVNFPPQNDGTTDLLTVAAHEIGHALGLDHSSDRGALMFPSYTGPHRFLGLDDIEGIRFLYGPGQNPFNF